MCGIFGTVGFGFSDRRQPEYALNVMAHRGPDDADLDMWAKDDVVLGQRRLSIIDLSSAGRNPMSNEDGTVWITFNGEIYNFRSLREELMALGHQFRSQTDTEVIIHAYEEWGDDHVDRLRGMFAYAIYDSRRTNDHQKFRILIVRDRLGIKPIYYLANNGRLAFASELKGLLALPNFKPQIDPTALWDYLTYYYIPAPKTAYQGIFKLPPGHKLVFENGNFTISRYWAPPDRVDDHWTIPDAVVALTTHLEEVVRLHMVSDVPLGVFLSGGLDSSIVTALAANLSEEPLKTFSIGFDVPGFSETADARLMAAAYHTDHAEHIVDQQSAAALLGKVVEMYDEPFADGSAVPTFALSQHTRSRVTVALSGDGGDELFWGYRWYADWQARQPSIKRDLPTPLREPLQRLWRSMGAPGGRVGRAIDYGLMDELARYAHRRVLFTGAEKRRIGGRAWRDFGNDYPDLWHFRDHWRPDADYKSQVQWLDLMTYLPGDILTKVDRASMAVSLEVRPPLLDHVLCEFMFRLPPEVRIPNNELKGLLRKIAPAYLPKPLLNKPKKGFSAPWSHWLTGDHAWIANRLDRGAAVEHGFIKPGISQQLNSGYGGERLWALLVLDEWLRRQT